MPAVTPKRRRRRRPTGAASCTSPPCTTRGSWPSGTRLRVGPEPAIPHAKRPAGGPLRPRAGECWDQPPGVRTPPTARFRGPDAGRVGGGRAGGGQGTGCRGSTRRSWRRRRGGRSTPSCEPAARPPVSLAPDATDAEPRARRREGWDCGPRPQPARYPQTNGRGRSSVRGRRARVDMRPARGGRAAQSWGEASESRPRRISQRRGRDVRQCTAPAHQGAGPIDPSRESAGRPASAPIGTFPTARGGGGAGVQGRGQRGAAGRRPRCEPGQRAR